MLISVLKKQGKIDANERRPHLGRCIVMTVLRACWDLCLIPVFFTSCNTNQIVYICTVLCYILSFACNLMTFVRPDVVLKCVFWDSICSSWGDPVRLTGCWDPRTNLITYVCFVFCFFRTPPKMGTAVCLCKRCFLCPLCRLCRKTTRRWPPCRKPSPRTSSSPTWMTTRGGRSLCQWLQWLRVLSWLLKGTPSWRRRLTWESRKCAGVFFCWLCVDVLSMLMLHKDLFCVQLELRAQPFRFALYQWKGEKGRLVT